jgi:hypothetical protein
VNCLHAISKRTNANTSRVLHIDNGKHEPLCNDKSVKKETVFSWASEENATPTCKKCISICKKHTCKECRWGEYLHKSGFWVCTRTDDKCHFEERTVR